MHGFKHQCEWGIWHNCRNTGDNDKMRIIFTVYMVTRCCQIQKKENKTPKFCGQIIIASISFNQDQVASMVTQLVKNLPAIQHTLVQLWVRKIPWRMDRLPSPVFFVRFPCDSAVKSLPVMQESQEMQV